LAEGDVFSEFVRNLDLHNPFADGLAFSNGAVEDPEVHRIYAKTNQAPPTTQPSIEIKEK
jgi:hypothetical protein